MLPREHILRNILISANLSCTFLRLANYKCDGLLAAIIIALLSNSSNPPNR